MSKKGALALMTKVGIGLVIGVILVLFGLTLWKSFIGIFFPTITEQTESSISDLENQINELGAGENTTMLFYSTKGFVLVAFDKSRTSGSGTLNYYERPVACYDRACLVVCKDTDSKNSCKNSEMVKVFDLDSFEIENPDTGIIPLVERGYSEIKIERLPNIIKIMRV